MKVLNKEELLKLNDKDSVSGLCVLGNIEKKPTKNGGSFFDGVAKVGGTIPIKVWGNSSAYQILSEADLSGAILQISGSMNVWNDTKSIVIDSISIPSDEDLNLAGISIADFDFTSYDLDENEKAFYTFLRERLSNDAFLLFREIYMRSDIRSRFKEEYAAIFYHDAQRGGLLAHTYKILQILDTVWGLYGGIQETVNKDLVYLGVALHDIGKIFEYNNGSAAEFAFATHNFLGQELLFQFKEQIVNGFSTEFKKEEVEVSGFGEEFYYRLQAILQQHHGEFGEPCHTIESYIVHKVDMLEASFQKLNESLPFEGRLPLEGKYKVE